MAGKGGGAWKVAYADFTTAMMAFFLVMWITSQSQDIKEAVANHFRSPFGRFDSGGAILPPFPSPDRDEDPTGYSRIKPPPSMDPESQKSKNPYVLRMNNGDRTIVGTMVIFPEGSAELDETAQKGLKGLIPMIAGKPQKIEIRGHASRRPPKPGMLPPDAWRLSYERCLKTLEFLEQQGIKADRIRLSQAGAFEPYLVPSSSQRVARDSRVEVFLLNETCQDYFRAREAPPAGETAAHPHAPTGET